jgi:hypothetical protein
MHIINLHVKITLRIKKGLFIFEMPFLINEEENYCFIIFAV